MTEKKKILVIEKVHDKGMELIENHLNFEFEVIDLQEHNSNINFYITLTDDSGNEFVTNILLSVESFEIDILSAEITNDTNQNGKLDPGESSNLYLVVKNDGTIWSPELTCALTTESEDLIVYNNQVIITEIDPGSTINTNALISVTLLPTAFNGEVKILDIDCQSDSDFSLFNQQNIDVGTTTVASAISASSAIRKIMWVPECLYIQKYSFRVFNTFLDPLQKAYRLTTIDDSMVV